MDDKEKTQAAASASAYYAETTAASKEASKAMAEAEAVYRLCLQKESEAYAEMRMLTF